MAHLGVGQALHSLVAPIGIAQEGGQFYQGQSQFSQGQESVGQEPDHARGNAGIYMPDLDHHVGQEPGDALRCGTGKELQGVEAHRPGRVQGVEHYYAFLQGRIILGQGGGAQQQVVEQVAVRVENTHAAPRLDVGHNPGLDGPALTGARLADDPEMGGPLLPAEHHAASSTCAKLSHQRFSPSCKPSSTAHVPQSGARRAR